MGYLTPIPGFVCVLLPMIFACDWYVLLLPYAVPRLTIHRYNRDDFENNMNNALRRRDLIKIKDYYSRSPSSGLFILEYGDRFVGLIAVDASQDSTSREVIISADSKAKVSYTKGTSDVAVIRHFHVEDAFRVAGIQTDLLQFALRHLFEKSSKVNTVKAVEFPLVSYVGKTLRKEGFKKESVFDKVGSLRWERNMMALDRETWEKRTKSKS